MKALAPLVAVASLFAANVARADNPVIVHEWGTFTSLQDENGKAIGGINVDDEPAPNFVYTAGQRRVVALNHNPYTFGLPPYCGFQGKGGTLAPVGDPEVTMRLETPVLYIYPPKGEPASAVPPLDVNVDFHGGILSQYYPYATTLGAAADTKGPIALTDHTMSGLYWNSVRLGSTGTPVQTQDQVWTTPRETNAPLLEVHPKMKDVNGVVHDDAQVEHFLFYRGVGHLDSPLHISSTERLTPLGAGPICIDPEPYPETFTSTGWLADIRADGSCAFTALPSISIPEKAAWKPNGCRFSASDFSAGNLTKLQASMQAALVKAGLYPDEASAMLRTWELSYFKSPGLRFFYIVPRAWVDKTLPLTITGAPVEITRVMVGRIELISDEQKTTLARLKQEASPNLMSLKQAAYEAMQSGKYSKMEQAEFDSGARPLTDLGLTLSPSVRDYLSLGRFRDALIIHEQQEHPSDNLARFIKDNDLAAR
jgi:hypothetical protein